MVEMLEFLKIYKDYGVAGLFIALLLVVVFYFYKELKSSKAEALQQSEQSNAKIIALTEKIISVADKAASSISDNNDMSADLKTALDQMRTQNNECISFFKGRDEGHRRTAR